MDFPLDLPRSNCQKSAAAKPFPQISGGLKVKPVWNFVS
jgi:hypothetical protein